MSLKTHTIVKVMRNLKRVQMEKHTDDTRSMPGSVSVCVYKKYKNKRVRGNKSNKHTAILTYSHIYILKYLYKYFIYSYVMDLCTYVHMYVARFVKEIKFDKVVLQSL